MASRRNTAEFLHPVAVLAPLAFLALLVLTTIASAGTMLPLPTREERPSTDTIDDLAMVAVGLNAKIGSYPPSLSSGQDRRDTYAKWSDTLQRTWSTARKAPDSEASLWVLSELYRQGNNLDVAETDRLADETIRKCLALYPNSIRCHFSAAYYYLSINPKYAPRGEASLLRLRELLKPKVVANVEKGLVFAYLYEGRKQDAGKQLDYYLTLDPKADWALKFKDALDKGKIEFRHEE